MTKSKGYHKHMRSNLITGFQWQKPEEEKTAGL